VRARPAHWNIIFVRPFLRISPHSEEDQMNGWFEWIIYTASMVLAGIGLLAFFFNPLLALLIGAAIGLASWMSAAPRPDR